MTVYELIKELTAYPPDTEVYFKASCYVIDLKSSMEEQEREALMRLRGKKNEISM